MNRAIGGMLVAALVISAASQPRAQANRNDQIYAALRTNALARLRSLVRSSSDANVRDEQGNTPLIDAAAVGSVAAVRFLLDSGAEVNAQNNAGLSALMMAATDLSKTRELLDRGAKVNATTQTGRSALFLALMARDSAPIARLLLAKGADPTIVDAFKNTMLNAAAAGNDTDAIRMMVDAGIDVNAAAVTGTAPLALVAGQQNVTATKLLLAKGANPNAVGDPGMAAGGPDPKAGAVVLHAYTPLLAAAAFGPAELVQALLDAGANVNAVEGRKLSALMLAVASDHQDPAVIRLLLARGANPALKSAQGDTAADWATRVGAPDAIGLLHAEKPQVAAVETTTAPLDPRTAVERSVALLEKSSQIFYDGSGCVSCHAQSITDLAVAEARARRVRVDESAAAGRNQMLRNGGGFPVDVLYQRLDIHVPEIIEYQLAGLAANQYPADRLTDAMAINVAVHQSQDGAWHPPSGIQQRPGGEDGEIFRTALGIRSLKAYGPPARGEEMQARIARARAWLLRARPLTSEDRNMQLLGLYWAGASQSSLRRIGDTILAAQRPDGGWAQRDGLGSDAYATGEALYALAKPGVVIPSTPAYQQGVKFLLATQRADDGSWRVKSRSPKFQVPFQSFPYAGDQWISQWGTGWATMALAQAIETRRSTD